MTTFKGSCCKQSESSRSAVRMGTQYFDRREKDSLVLTAPTRDLGRQQSLPASFHSSLKRTRLSEFLRLFVSPRCQEALVLSKHRYGRLLTQNYLPLWP